MAIYSKQFEDIYFSPEDGLAETRHVFLDGNSLPEAWSGRHSFTIAETGFGTGLNFLAAWALFEKTARPDQQLHYISFEKYPLSWDEIYRAVSPWRQEFGGRLDRLRALYPIRVPGFHRVLVNEQITLTLIFDDVNEALPQLDVPRGVDAWFLDGFAPSKNPDMWSDVLFGEMARLSHAQTTLATFTVAGAVRRGLESAGFSIEKKKGFGRKNEMLCGSFKSGRLSLNKDIKKIAIVGGGLAGTAAAFVLKRRGMQPTIFEKESAFAAGASGNELGLFNPRLSMYRTPESDFYTAGFAQAVRTLAELQRGHDIELNPCGSLHLITDEAKEKRFSGALQNWRWHKNHMYSLDAEAASQRAGLRLKERALCLPDAGTVSPSALCAAYADGIDMRLNAVPDIEELHETYGAVVLACGAGAVTLPQLKDLPLHTVRGQVTHFSASRETFDLRMNLCFGGYLSPHKAGRHILGATFQRWREDSDITDEDHHENIVRLHEIMPNLSEPQITGGRAALRLSSKDRFPVIGKLMDNLFVSTAHGSHGILSSLAGAHLIADMITEDPRSLPRDTARKLDPARFTPQKARG